jgi:hypothetical protein
MPISDKLAITSRRSALAAGRLSTKERPRGPESRTDFLQFLPCSLAMMPGRSDPG